MFSIHQSTGVVTLGRSLDYETQMQHTISIVVQVRRYESALFTSQLKDNYKFESYFLQDRGNPPNRAVEDLTVTVGDVNDRNPAFQRNDYFAEIHENLTFVCSSHKALELCVNFTFNSGCQCGTSDSI